MTRDTSTGNSYEEIIEFVIAKSGLKSKKQVIIGIKPGGRQHRIDHIVWNDSNPDTKALISCKVQNVGGTAEEKIVYEIIKLLHAMDTYPEYKRAYLILGGQGWTPELIVWLRSGLTKYVPDAKRVIILNTDELITAKISI